MRKLVLALAFLTACSSLNQPPTPGRPEIEVFQQNPLFFGSANESVLNLEVTIRNPAKEPIVVRRVRLTAGIGMTQYSVYPAERRVLETIAPGESKVVYVAATAYTNITRLTATEPLGLRAILDYESAGKRRQELYVPVFVSQ
jgi:hypothetical protein